MENRKGVFLYSYPHSYRRCVGVNRRLSKTKANLLNLVLVTLIPRSTLVMVQSAKHLVGARRDTAPRPS